MTATYAPRTGTLVITVWSEASATHPWRARIVGVVDLASRKEAQLAASTVDDVCAAVREWLDAFATGGQLSGWGQGR